MKKIQGLYIILALYKNSGWVARKVGNGRRNRNNATSQTARRLQWCVRKHSSLISFHSASEKLLIISKIQHW